MANQFLSLALFLMLLSFFIVMNSVSNFEETKTKPVMNSLIIAFSNRTPDRPEDPSPTPSPLMAISEGDTLSSLEGLFSGHMANFQASKNRLGTVMHVQADIEEFEDAISVPPYDNYNDVGIGVKGSFTQTMITLLRSEQKGHPYRIDIILNTQEDPAIYQKNSPELFSRDLKRVSGFAQKLEESGLDKKMVSAGMGVGKVGFVDLYFYRYQPFDIVSQIKEDKRRKGDL